MYHDDNRLSIGFVTYHPTEMFYRRLSILKEMGIDIYVFDNSPENRDTLKACDGHQNIKYITAGDNVGLGLSLATITSQSFQDGNELLLFFDQDTSFTENTIRYIQAFCNKNSQLIYSGYAAIVFDGKLEENQNNSEITDVLLAISSGSLFLLKILNTIGWHNNKYFVDGVDYEMCLRARKMGYKIGVHNNTIGFDHKSEQPDKVINMFGKELMLRRYPKTRIIDSVRAFQKLSFFTIRNFDFAATVRIIRCYLIYFAGQVIARIVIRKEI